MHKRGGNQSMFLMPSLVFLFYRCITIVDPRDSPYPALHPSYAEYTSECYTCMGYGVLGIEFGGTYLEHVLASWSLIA